MPISTSLCDTCLENASKELDWAELYPRLFSIVKRLVYQHRLPSWRGQEEDMAQDITQETAKRLIVRLQKAARREATPVNAPEHMMVTIAINCVRDMMRREYRVKRLPTEELTNTLIQEGDNLLQLAEVATESVYHEWIFHQLAHEIAHFPPKQRHALLNDLANRMHFEDQPTLLQTAFLSVGIDLQDYQKTLPNDPIKRAQHSALLCHAYKRLAQFADLAELEIAA